MPVDTPALHLIWSQQTSEIDLAPLDGLWTEPLYLKISEQTNHLIEFVDGSIEVLPMPTRRHQIILAFLYDLFVATVRPRGGKVLFAPLRLRIRAGKFRDPDMLVLLDASDPRNQEQFWLGADLVIEIVSKDDPGRDTITKRNDYADAGIPEYWIVNPLDETISVLVLHDDSYIEHGVFRRGERATSTLVPNIGVVVDDVFDAH